MTQILDRFGAGYRRQDKGASRPENGACRPKGPNLPRPRRTESAPTGDGTNAKAAQEVQEIQERPASGRRRVMGCGAEPHQGNQASKPLNCQTSKPPNFQTSRQQTSRQQKSPRPGRSGAFVAWGRIIRRRGFPQGSRRGRRRGPYRPTRGRTFRWRRRGGSRAW